MKLIELSSGIVYEEPSEEIEGTILIGRGWLAIIRYHSRHPMLSHLPNWQVDIWEGESYEGFAI